MTNKIDIDNLLELESKASKAPYRLENHNKLSADNKLVPYSKDDAELDVAMRNNIRPLLLELKAARRAIEWNKAVIDAFSERQEKYCKVVEAARVVISSNLLDYKKDLATLEQSLKELDGEK